MKHKYLSLTESNCLVFFQAFNMSKIQLLVSNHWVLNMTFRLIRTQLLPLCNSLVNQAARKFPYMMTNMSISWMPKSSMIVMILSRILFQSECSPIYEEDPTNGYKKE